MIATVVHVWVKEGFQEAFIKATHQNHLKTLKEAGNIQFDVLQDVNHPLKFSLYEVFKDQTAIDLHKTTAHYIKWRDTVADMMQKPREADKNLILFP